jgi:hypothetical protein
MMRLSVLLLLMHVSWCGEAISQAEQDALWLKAMEESKDVESKRAEDLKISHDLYEQKVAEAVAAKEQQRQADAAEAKARDVRQVLERYGVDLSGLPSSVDDRFFTVDEIPERWRGAYFRAMYSQADASVKTAVASKFSISATTGTIMAENGSMLTVKAGQIVMAKIGETELLMLPEWPSATKRSPGLFLVSGTRSIVAKMHGVWPDGRIESRIDEYFERVVDPK